jgi:hypothetical protein
MYVIWNFRESPIYVPQLLFHKVHSILKTSLWLSFGVGEFDFLNIKL